MHSGEPNIMKSSLGMKLFMGVFQHPAGPSSALVILMLALQFLQDFLDFLQSILPEVAQPETEDAVGSKARFPASPYECGDSSGLQGSLLMKPHPNIFRLPFNGLH